MLAGGTAGLSSGGARTVPTRGANCPVYVRIKPCLDNEPSSTSKSGIATTSVPGMRMRRVARLKTARIALCIGGPGADAEVLEPWRSFDAQLFGQRTLLRVVRADAPTEMEM